MSDIALTISNAIQGIGTNFIFAYYLPAFIFTLLNVYVIIPFAINPTSGTVVNLINALPTIAGIDLNRIIELIGLPLIIAIFLSGLNELFSRLFSRGWKVGNSRNDLDRTYRLLETLRRAYREITRRSLSEDGQASSENKEMLLKLQMAIDAEHKLIASHHRHTPDELKTMEPATPELQQKLARTSKSDFGKALLLAQEYALDHYRFDLDVFWSRLQILIIQKSPADAELLSDTKNRVNLMMNISVIAFCLFIEGLFILLKNFNTPSIYTNFFLAMTGVSLISMVVFYHGSAQAMTELSELIKINVDRHRHLVAEMFGLKKPALLNEERLMWEELTTFIQRGDPFYFPKQPIISEKVAHEDTNSPN